MNPKVFNALVESQLNACKDVLGVKAAEYARDTDRLANFKKAAALQGCTPAQACTRLMCKHIVAIYDFVDLGETDHGKWIEKITDSLNYLLLLHALLIEQGTFGKTYILEGQV